MRFSLFFIIAISMLSSCFNPKPEASKEPEHTKSPKELNVPLIRHEKYYEDFVADVLDKNCQHCHENKAKNYQSAFALIELGDESKSQLIQKVSGNNHPMVFAPLSREMNILSYWAKGELTEPREEAVLSITSLPLDVDLYEHLLAGRLESSCQECHESYINSYADAVKYAGKLSGLVQGVWEPTSLNIEILKRWLSGDTIASLGLGVNTTQPVITPEDEAEKVLFDKKFFQNSLKPILNKDCSNSNCHASGISFDYVIANAKYQDLDESAVYSTGRRFWSRKSQLQPDHLRVLESWIMGNPMRWPETQLSRDDYYKVLQPRLQLHCKECHKEFDSFKNSFFAIVETVIQQQPEESPLYKMSINQLEGHPIRNRLTEADKLLIKKWINLEPIQ